MVATTECVEKSKPVALNKVSKPLMEKKRRARINKCLDQLKSLLESYYSSSIRKRKLEKADILELTVKHLRNLQKIQSCTANATDFSDYQSGFRSCLANFNQYLLMADNLSGSERWMLSKLSSKLRCSSTMDRAEAPEHAQRAAGPEDGRTATYKAPKPQGASACRVPHSPTESGTRRGVHAGQESTQQNTHERRSGHKKFHRNAASSTQHSVWRPW